jgi:hypothetical protein
MPGYDIVTGWHEFYLLIGTAAATFVALLFVAVSIGAGSMSAESASATRIYMSPVIFHFTSILFISLIVLIPSHPRELHAALIALNAVAGAAASILICTRVFVGARGPSEVDWIDWLAYGVSPVLAYVGALAAAVLLFANSAVAPDFLSAAVLVLLIANIRNAWDITLVMARRRSGSQ